MTAPQPASPGDPDPLQSGDPLRSDEAAPAGRGGVDLGKGGSEAPPAWGEQRPAVGGGWGEQPGAGQWAPPAGPPAQQGQGWGEQRPPGWSGPGGAPGAPSPTPVGLILGISSLVIGFFSFPVLTLFWALVTIVTLPLSIAGWIVSSRELRARPDLGTARAGRIVGMVGVGLSVALIAITIVIAILVVIGINAS